MSTPPHLRLPACATARTLETARGPFAVHDASPVSDPLATALLVPGFTGSKEDFITVLEPLAEAGYRVLAIDQRGQFETPGPGDPGAYDLDALGADLIAIGAGVADGPVHLVGHSFGGLAARAAAIAAPKAVRSVTLLCSGPGPIPEQEAARAQLLRELLAELELTEIWALIFSMASANGEHDGVAPEVLDFLGRRFTCSAKAGLSAMAAQLLDTADRCAELAATGLPLLVAYGEDDFVWPPAEQAEMAGRLSARRVVIAGAAHSPAVQRPAETAALLAEFWSAAP